MKVSLVFDLPEESAEHMAALNGPKYSMAIEDFDGEARRLIKYGSFKDEFEAWREKKNKEGYEYKDDAEAGFCFARDLVFGCLAEAAIRS